MRSRVSCGRHSRVAAADTLHWGWLHNPHTAAWHAFVCPTPPHRSFVLRRKMFDASETSLLQQAARSDKLLEDNTFSIADGEGGKNDLTLWRHPGDNIYGMVMRCARLVRSAEAILQEEVYHYQTKVRAVLAVAVLIPWPWRGAGVTARYG